MKKSYLVLVDGKLWDKKLTRIGAMKVIEFLRNKGLAACLAYSLALFVVGLVLPKDIPLQFPSPTCPIVVTLNNGGK